MMLDCGERTKPERRNLTSEPATSHLLCGINEVKFLLKQLFRRFIAEDFPFRIVVVQSQFYHRFVTMDTFFCFLTIAGSFYNAPINPENPKSGDDVKITPKPDEGFEVDEIKVTDKDGNEIEVKKNDDGSFTFVMPEDDVKIEVTFKKSENDLPVAPQTGDSFNIALWTILMCLAVSGVFYAVAWKRQRKRVKGS